MPPGIELGPLEDGLPVWRQLEPTGRNVGPSGLNRKLPCREAALSGPAWATAFIPSPSCTASRLIHCTQTTLLPTCPHFSFWKPMMTSVLSHYWHVQWTFPPSPCAPNPFAVIAPTRNSYCPLLEGWMCQNPYPAVSLSPKVWLLFQASLNAWWLQARGPQIWRGLSWLPKTKQDPDHVHCSPKDGLSLQFSIWISNFNTMLDCVKDKICLSLSIHFLPFFF